MKYKETEILRKIEIKLPDFDIEVILKALELYITNIKHLYNNKFIKNEDYDDIYFCVWCLYNIFMYNLTENQIIYNEIPLYKRITTNVKVYNLRKYQEYYNKVA